MSSRSLIASKATNLSAVSGINGSGNRKCNQCFCSGNSNDSGRRSRHQIMIGNDSVAKCRACSQCSCKLRSTTSLIESSSSPIVMDKVTERCVILRKNNNNINNIIKSQVSIHSDDAASDSGACSDESIKIVIMGQNENQEAKGGSYHAIRSSSKLCERYSDSKGQLRSANGLASSSSCHQHRCGQNYLLNSHNSNNHQGFQNR